MVALRPVFLCDEVGQRDALKEQYRPDVGEGIGGRRRDDRVQQLVQRGTEGGDDSSVDGERDAAGWQAGRDRLGPRPPSGCGAHVSAHIRDRIVGVRCGAGVARRGRRFALLSFPVDGDAEYDQANTGDLDERRELLQHDDPDDDGGRG